MYLKMVDLGELKIRWKGHACGGSKVSKCVTSAAHLCTNEIGVKRALVVGILEFCQ